MTLNIRKFLSICEDTHEEADVRDATPVRKVAVVAVLQNPLAGTKGADLSDLIAESEALGAELGTRLVAAMGSMEVQSYGKGGLVGLQGEREHAHALLTTTFANPIRKEIGQCDAWISSFQKVVAPNTPIDIPMNHIGDVYVRSHYDGMSLMVPGGPLPDEIAIIFCAASRGRLAARVGGLTHDEVVRRETRG